MYLILDLCMNRLLTCKIAKQLGAMETGFIQMRYTDGKRKYEQQPRSKEEVQRALHK